MFLTDGYDNVPQETRLLSQELKRELITHNIYSKFSVLGIGTHDAGLLGMLTDIGTQRGIYVYLEPGQTGPEMVK